MKDKEIDELLSGPRCQRYPLSVSKEAGEAMVICIQRIMAAVHEDDRPMLRADYDAVTSALHHPNPVDPPGDGP